MGNCQHFVRVMGRRVEFIPGSDVVQTGVRLEFPVPPPGVTVRVLATNPQNPEDQLWSLCIDKTVPGNMQEFYSTTGVTQLTYQEMVQLGKSFDPNFIPPPVII